MLVKHANACGAAVDDDLVEAFRRALGADELSAFGGVFALTGEIDVALATAIADGPQADVILAASAHRRREGRPHRASQGHPAAHDACADAGAALAAQHRR